MDQGVILKVEEARNRGGRDEIRLSYDGTSEFRKYTEYLVKQKIELLLPHKERETLPRGRIHHHRSSTRARPSRR